MDRFPLIPSLVLESQPLSSTQLTACSHVLCLNLLSPPAGLPLHLAHVVVCVPVRGADGLDHALAGVGTADAVGDALVEVTDVKWGVK